MRSHLWRVLVIGFVIATGCARESATTDVGDLDGFCEIAASPMLVDAFFRARRDPTDTNALKALDDLIASLNATAPPGIVDAVETYRSATREFLADLASGDSSPDASTTMNRSGEAITDFASERCF